MCFVRNHVAHNDATPKPFDKHSIIKVKLLKEREGAAAQAAPLTSSQALKADQYAVQADSGLLVSIPMRGRMNLSRFLRVASAACLSSSSFSGDQDGN